MIDASNKLLWDGGFFVQPILNRILSDFCRELTSISQDDVDTALPLPVVLSTLAAQVMNVASCKLADCTFISWGKYDRTQFEKDCARHNIPYPFGPHVNLKAEFLRKHSVKRAGVQNALNTIGLSFEGTYHRGADDALNIARIFLKEFGSDYPFEFT